MESRLPKFELDGESWGRRVVGAEPAVPASIFPFGEDGFPFSLSATFMLVLFRSLILDKSERGLTTFSCFWGLAVELSSQSF